MATLSARVSLSLHTRTVSLDKANEGTSKYNIATQSSHAAVLATLDSLFGPGSVLPLSQDLQAIDYVGTGWVVIYDGETIVFGRSRQGQPYDSLNALGRSTLTELDAREFATDSTLSPRLLSEEGTLYWFKNRSIYSRSAEGREIEILDAIDRSSYRLSNADADLILSRTGGFLEDVSAPRKPLFALANEIVLRTSFGSDTPPFGSNQGIAVVRIDE